jgi:hypothetical protein
MLAKGTIHGIGSLNDYEVKRAIAEKIDGRYARYRWERRQCGLSAGPNIGIEPWASRLAAIDGNAACLQRFDPDSVERPSRWKTPFLSSKPGM